MDDPEEMDKFLETNSLPRLSQEETDNLNRLIITRSETESIIIIIKQRKTPYKRKSRTGLLHWGIVPNIWRTYIYPSHTIPKKN